MLWIIACVMALVVVATVIAITTRRDVMSGEGEFCEFLKFSLAVIAIAVIIGGSALCGIHIIESLSYEEVNLIAKNNLVSLQENGSISDGPVYIRESAGTVYYRIATTEQFKIPVAKVVIFDQYDYIPHVLVYEVDIKNKVPKVLHWILSFGYPNKHDGYRCEFYVPKGSALQTINKK